MSEAQLKAEAEALEIIAQAVTEASGGGWDEMGEDERMAMRSVAAAAVTAHYAWLDAAGYRLVPPGMTLRPATENEAREMAKQVRAYLDQPEHARARRKGLMDRPNLILPYDA